MRTLSAIETDFTTIAQGSEPERTLQLVGLMNEMERDYDTFKINPTPEVMSRPEYILYRMISYARRF